MTLSSDQLTAIDRHLRKDNWLQNEALVAELTDHYADAIADAISHGIPFELALMDVHKAFVGRKGLLRMGQEYAKTQALANSRAGWMFFRSYFRMPRLLWSIAVLTIVYGLTLWWKSAGEPELVNWVFVGIMMVLAADYITALIKLTKSETLASAQEGLRPDIYLGQGVVGMMAIVCFLQILLPIKAFIGSYPLAFALLVTPVIIYEAATAEMIVLVLRPQTT